MFRTSSPGWLEEQRSAGFGLRAGLCSTDGVCLLSLYWQCRKMKQLAVRCFPDGVTWLIKIWLYLSPFNQFWKRSPAYDRACSVPHTWRTDSYTHSHLDQSLLIRIFSPVLVSFGKAPPLLVFPFLSNDFLTAAADTVWINQKIIEISHRFVCDTVNASKRINTKSVSY